ncbi:hypothetical protein D3C81_1601270 [compost metagenome]
MRALHQRRRHADARARGGTAAGHRNPRAHPATGTGADRRRGRQAGSHRRPAASHRRAAVPVACGADQIPLRRRAPADPGPHRPRSAERRPASGYRRALCECRHRSSRSRCRAARPAADFADHHPDRRRPGAADERRGADRHSRRRAAGLRRAGSRQAGPPDLRRLADGYQPAVPRRAADQDRQLPARPDPR